MRSASSSPSCEERQFVAELIDANEPGIALEELSATLAKGEKQLDEEAIVEIRSLGETMGLDADVADQLEPFVRR